MVGKLLLRYVFEPPKLPTFDVWKSKQANLASSSKTLDGLSKDGPYLGDATLSYEINSWEIIFGGRN
jgi:hypothetical protein